MSFDLHALNPAQLKAVLHTQGPCLIIAGPGAGKTRVISYRVAHLIYHKGVSPHSLLVLTFTNKAGREIKQRIEQLLEGNVDRLWIGTFHSLFSRILRIEAEHLGYPKDFSIYDREDTKALLKRILKEMKLTTEQYPLSWLIHRISRAKNALLTPQQYVTHGWAIEDQTHDKPHTAQIYAQYDARCRQAHAMDFDDLLLFTYQLFQEHPKVLEKYQYKFTYVMVDEVQDSNELQYTILKMLVAQHHNLCIIGDDAQSIYAFRGADIDNMLSFQKSFPQAHMITLEQNYRSSKRIVRVANELIRKNQQYKKHLFTDNEEGEKIEVHALNNDLEEAQFVAQSIASLHLSKQVPWHECAILYRNNSQSRSLEEALRQQNIPYKVVGGMSFYQRKEIKDILAYLHLLINPNNEEALSRALGTPKRGIGPGTIAKIRAYAVQQQLSLWDTMKQARKGSTRTAQALLAFVEMIECYRSQLDTLSLEDIARGIAQTSGLSQALYQDKTLQGVSRYENLEAFFDNLAAIGSSPSPPSLAELMQELALFTGEDHETHEDIPPVQLMTIHGAKGLEFGYVYIVGMERNLFPSHRSMENPDQLPEERRLFFVAITRAKRKVIMTLARNRWQHGKPQQTRPSPFLYELNQKDVLFIGSRKSKPPSSPQNSIEKPPSSRSRSLRPIRQAESKNGATQLRPEQLPLGTQVTHPTFGHGEVIECSVASKPYRVVIDFGAQGKKTLLIDYAPLSLC